MGLATGARAVDISCSWHVLARLPPPTFGFALTKSVAVPRLHAARTHKVTLSLSRCWNIESATRYILHRIVGMKVSFISPPDTIHFLIDTMAAEGHVKIEYDAKNMPFRRLGRSGLRVPLFSLGGCKFLGMVVLIEYRR
jgi:hypothetical protein